LPVCEDTSARTSDAESAETTGYVTSVSAASLAPLPAD